METNIETLRVMKQVATRVHGGTGSGPELPDDFDPRPEAADIVNATDLPSGKKAELYADLVHQAAFGDYIPE